MRTSCSPESHHAPQHPKPSDREATLDCSYSWRLCRATSPTSRPTALALRTMGIFSKKKKAAAHAQDTQDTAESQRSSGDGSHTNGNTPSTSTGIRANPFATPRMSRATTQEKGDFQGCFQQAQTKSYGGRRRKFQSARLRAGEYDEKPWVLGKEDPNFKRRRLERIMFWSCVAIGVVIGAAICALEYINVSTGQFCLWYEGQSLQVRLLSCCAIPRRVRS